jgi:hypothetical protein
MKPNKLTRASITISVSNDSSLRMQTQFASHVKGAVKPATPNEVLIAAADEIARIATLCGFDEDIVQAVLDARKRVKEWIDASQPT